MSLITKALLAVIAALVLAVCVLWWQVEAHKNAAIDAAVAPAKEQAVIAAAKVETVTVTLAATRDTVLRVLTRVRTDTLVLRPQAPQDTATALAQFPALSAAYDTLQRSCKAFVVSCDEYRAAAETRFRADSTLNAKLEAQLKARPLPKRFSLGITAGYGATAYRDRRDSLPAWRVITGPSATVGGTLRLW